LPKWLTLSDGDNELPIDLDNVLSLDTLIELVKNRESVTLIELFPDANRLVVKAPEGRFVHELVVPFVRNAGTRPVPPNVGSEFQRAIIPETPGFQRRFPPGADWLYAKLYAGPATIDELLRVVVQPVVESALGSGAAHGWFFIRYGDPDWHLRLRFCGRPDRLINEVFPLLRARAAPLLNDGRLWRLQLDTYEREVERYGGQAGVRLTERIFEADSNAVLALTDLFHLDSRGEFRWRLAVVGMHRTLLDLGLTLDQRRSIARAARDRFAAEFHSDSGIQRQLCDKYRTQRAKVTELLQGSPQADESIARGIDILNARSNQWAPAIAELRECAQTGRLTLPLSELAPSFLHMHANRMLRSAHRAQELVLYDFLMRHYDSLAARAQSDDAIVASEIEDLRTGFGKQALPAVRPRFTVDDRGPHRVNG
jgi:thiopeptide-type bacteriocin biosynthesis protein